MNSKSKEMEKWKIKKEAKSFRNAARKKLNTVHNTMELD